MQGRTKILVVDDERVIASTLATILQRQGYETANAYSGEEAVEVADSFEPDFLLSDIAMGAMNGIDAAIEILGFLPHCKVLFLSGHAASQDLLEHARAQGFDFEILNKPVSPPELLARISQVFSFEPTNPKARTLHKPPTTVTSNTQIKLFIS
jgi:CheY-like chemotaxis protein